MALLTPPVIDARRVYAASLPILGKDGPLARTATTPPARGHARAKPATTTVPGRRRETLEPKGENAAGYIETRSGHRLAYALMVNDVVAIENIASDVADVFQDEAEIAQRHPPGNATNDRKRLSATPRVTCLALGPAVPEAPRTDPVSAAPTTHERKTP